MAARLAAFVVLFTLTGLLGLVSRRLARGNRAPSRELRSGAVLGLAHTSTLVSAALFPALGIGDWLLGPWAWVGVAAMPLAFAFQLWAMATLGPSYTLDLRGTADQEVVARGPYRVVRHPGYLAQLLCFVAFAVACQNLVTLAVVLLGMPLAYAYRISVEEGILRDVLGDRYATYAAGRARLVPGLW